MFPLTILSIIKKGTVNNDKVYIYIYIYLKYKHEPAKSYFSGAYSPTLYHFTGFFLV